MPINTHGGGARTNANGLRFEQETSLESALKSAGYTIDGNGNVYTDGNLVAISAPKNKLYKRILEPRNIYVENILSKKLLPDGALLNIETNTIYIIEKKFQNAAGSVDEKLQTCDFKRKQYCKLFEPVNIYVEYVYICNDYFNVPQYADVFNYIESVGCKHFFNIIPLTSLGL